MIDILLATYHPSPCHLEEQERSIRAQTYGDWRLISSEDAAGVGACANFAKLLEQSAGDYVAFSDQDDVWLPDKLERSMASMRELEARYGKDVPLLVFTDAKVVDRELNVIDDSLFHRTCLDPERRSPRQLILQNVANGNTMLFNAALRRKALPIPPDAFMHDHWVALVASVFGHAACVHVPTLLYRQHGANVIGATRVGLFGHIRRALRGISAMRRRHLANIRQAEAFARRYGEEAPPCFRVLVGFASRSWLVRRIILFRYGIVKRGLWRNLGLWCVT